MYIKPLIKWVGTKYSLINEILPYIKDKNRYFEPFIGGGAIYLNTPPMKEYHINDINEKLIITINQVKENPFEVIEEIKKIDNVFSEKDYDTQALIFKEKRDIFNKSKNDLEIASIFLFLNKVSYGGVYRVNSKGEFNNGFIRDGTQLNFDYDHLLKINNILNEKNTKTSFGDYRRIARHIDENSFVFLDPPYLDEEKKVRHCYTYESFDLNNYIELERQCERIDDKGGKFLLIHDEDEKIKMLFKDFNIKTVFNKKGIRKTGKAKELFISN